MLGSPSWAAGRAASSSPWRSPPRFAGRLRLVLVTATPEPLAVAPAAARRAVRQALVDAGVELICGVTATALEAGRLFLSDGSYVEVATALWATGVEGPPFLAASGIACDETAASA